MVPFNVKIDGHRVGITFESLVWFFVVTAAATVAGEVAYYYLQRYLPSLPDTSATATKKALTT